MPSIKYLTLFSFAILLFFIFQLFIFLIILRGKYALLQDRYEILCFKSKKINK